MDRSHQPDRALERLNMTHDEQRIWILGVVYLRT